MKKITVVFGILFILLIVLSASCTQVISIKSDNTQRQITHESVVHNYETAKNNPPNPPVITGPISGKKGVSYSYNFTITDPDDDLLFNLEIDWGDGTETIDCGCGKSWQSGTVVSVSHRWSRIETYLVTARVSDAYGTYSNWSESLPMSIPRQISYTSFGKIQGYIYSIAQSLFFDYGRLIQIK